MNDDDLKNLAEPLHPVAAEAIEDLQKRIKDVERHLDHHDAVDEIRRRGQRERARMVADRGWGVFVGLYAAVVIACLFPDQTIRLVTKLSGMRFDG